MPLILFLPFGPRYPKEGWRMLVRFYNPCHLDKISPDLFTFSDPWTLPSTPGDEPSGDRGSEGRAGVRVHGGDVFSVPGPVSMW